VAGQLLFTEQDAAHLGGVDHQQQHGIQGLGQGSGIGHDGGGTGLLQLAAGLLAEIDAVGGEPGPQAGAGGAHAHGPQADDSNMIGSAHLVIPR